mgnify:CR=1 FL=1
MTWNYRLVRKVTGNGFYFAIHEAYYTNDECDYITLDGVEVGGDTITECKSEYNMMKEAFKRPVLDYETRKELL